MPCVRTWIASKRALISLHNNCKRDPRGSGTRDSSQQDAGRRPLRLRVLARLIQIQRVLLKHGLDDFVRATHLYAPLRFLFYFTPAVWFSRRRKASRGERLRLALEELGPIFVKFGQAVSTRRDLLPVGIANELARLQDRVPPFPGSLAREAIERSYGQEIGAAFSSFE